MIFYLSFFKSGLCFTLMGMTDCCNPLSSGQNQFVVMSWIYQSVALGKYLSV